MKQKQSSRAKATPAPIGVANMTSNDGAHMRVSYDARRSSSASAAAHQSTPSSFHRRSNRDGILIATGNEGVPLFSHTPSPPRRRKHSRGNAINIDKVCNEERLDARCLKLWYPLTHAFSFHLLSLLQPSLVPKDQLEVQKGERQPKRVSHNGFVKCFVVTSAVLIVDTHASLLALARLSLFSGPFCYMDYL
jgi:hypothetical protein